VQTVRCLPKRSGRASRQQPSDWRRGARSAPPGECGGEPAGCRAALAGAVRSASTGRCSVPAAPRSAAAARVPARCAPCSARPPHRLRAACCSCRM